MAIQTLNTIKNWFRTGLKPTQTQFWDTWDSFRHKNQKVPVGDVEGIGELLSSKTDKSDFKTINGESILGSGDIGLDGGGSVEIKGVYQDNAAAKVGGLVAGDMYRTPMDGEDNPTSFIAIVADLPISKMTIYFEDIDVTMLANEITENTLEGWSDFLTNRGVTPTTLTTEANTMELIVEDYRVVENLSFGSMGIKTVMIDNFKNLQSLDLSNNPVNQPIDFDISNCPSFNNLGLSSCNLNEYDPIKQLPSLYILNLGSNNLTYFTPSLRVSDFMGVLDMSDNNLDSSFDLSSEIIGALDTLGLDNNNIIIFNPTWLPSNGLAYLLLRNNGMTEFNPDLDVNAGGRMQIFAIENNELTEFNPDNLAIAPGLMELGGNNITEYDPNMDMKNLYQLGLGGNPLTKFNPVNASYNNLIRLNLRNCPIDTATWNAETGWIGSVRENGTLNAGGNTNTEVGTNTETLLLAKNWGFSLT